MTECVVLLSGGMDSATLLYDKIRLHGHHQVHALTINYGQRHSRELRSARMLTALTQVVHEVLDINAVGRLLSGSALTSEEMDVPDGHYEEETMRITVVPNRNAILLSIAAGYAISQKARMVATAVHSGDHHIYPDCRPRFIAWLDKTIKTGNEGHCDPDFRISTPYIDIDKGAIARRGQELGVPWEKTWTCYKGGAIHCGSCGSCTERREALASVGDPTPYMTQLLTATATGHD